jgi:UMP-CMP kinase
MVLRSHVCALQVTVSLLQQAMQQSKLTKFLIDGFPRNADNMQMWLKLEHPGFQFAVELIVPEQVLQMRLLARQGGRTDDSHEVIAKRFQVRATPALLRAAVGCEVFQAATCNVTWPDLPMVLVTR